MSDTDFQKLRGIKENYAAKLARMNFEGRERSLADADVINVRHVQRCRELAETVLKIPSDLADKLSEECDARTVEDLLSASMRGALQGST